MDAFVRIAVLVIINIIGACFGKGSCDNRNHGCCSGTVWNETQKICTVCGPGFIGESCEIKCRYPLYGMGCLMVCSGKIDQYDFRTGCPNNEIVTEDTNKEGVDGSNKGTSECTSVSTRNLNRNSTGNTVDLLRQDRLSPLKISVIFLSAMLFVIVLVYFFSLKFKNVEEPIVGQERKEENTHYEDVQDLYLNP